jgi:glycosyltransferase involved in cell wall biosynthesis
VAATLRVCIDARLEPSAAGGVVNGILGLAHGLGGLTDEHDYRLLIRPGRGEWLEPYLGGGRLRVLEAVRAQAAPARPTLPARVAARVRRVVDKTGSELDALLSPSKGVAEAIGADVVHLPTQQGFRTRIPTIYHPWDLQHIHFPEFFPGEAGQDRDRLYRALATQAQLVVAPTRWVAEDVIENLAVPRRKVAIVPAASPLSIHPEATQEDIVRVRAAYQLDEPFVLYPAQTWPHKNHLALVEALAVVARDNLRIPVVCTGWRNDFHPTIERAARERGVANDLRFLGQVPAREMEALYRLAKALIFPSLIEGWGFPILEAYSVGLPVACSDVPSLREVVGTAALTFDPRRPDDLARQLRRIWEDDGLRRELAERGRAYSCQYSWERTAILCRAHYRRLAGLRLGEEDAALVRETAA